MPIAPSASEPGVSFVIPVHNGERFLEEVLASVFAQIAEAGPSFSSEVIVVDDGSTDGSRAILGRHAEAGTLWLLDGPRRGAAAASNLGIRAAHYPVVCQVDQDVVLRPGWMIHLLEALKDPRMAAAQGYYATDPSGPLVSRVMGYDLELRYAAIPGQTMDHVCTGNTAYRVAALNAVGLFDESLGYGYDNDMSYRLGAAGYSLAFCRQARSIHRWRQGLLAYLRQQYGVGYGRLELIRKHRGPRVRGDQVSGLRMILHVPLLLGALLLFAASGLSGLFEATGHLGAIAATIGALFLGLIVADRMVAGLQALVRFRDPAVLAFPVIHLLRDLAWVLALLLFCARRLRRMPSQPRHSMLR